MKCIEAQGWIASLLDLRDVSERNRRGVDTESAYYNFERGVSWGLTKGVDKFRAAITEHEPDPGETLSAGDEFRCVHCGEMVRVPGE